MVAVHSRSFSFILTTTHEVWVNPNIQSTERKKSQPLAWCKDSTRYLLNPWCKDPTRYLHDTGADCFIKENIDTQIISSHSSVRLHVICFQWCGSWRFVYHRISWTTSFFLGNSTINKVRLGCPMLGSSSIYLIIEPLLKNHVYISINCTYTILFTYLAST